MAPLLCTSVEVYLTTRDVNRYVLHNDVVLAASTTTVVRDQRRYQAFVSRHEQLPAAGLQ